MPKIRYNKREDDGERNVDAKREKRIDGAVDVQRFLRSSFETKKSTGNKPSVDAV
jgi:hypothetical protein